MATDTMIVSVTTECSVRIYRVECNERGHGELTVTQVTGDDLEDIHVIVEPCVDCLKAAECRREHGD